jgi:glycosyltransferase involved in cell wall biosynthesis
MPDMSPASQPNSPAEKRDQIPEIILVSAGLSPEGGGTASVGRMLLSLTAGYCRGRNIDFSVLHLGYPVDIVADVPVQHFSKSQTRLALTLWWRQIKTPRVRLIFDHLGPARTQAYVPEGLRGPYLLYLHGRECWRPLRLDQRRALTNASIRLANSNYSVLRARHYSPWLSNVDILPPAVETHESGGMVDHALQGKFGAGYLLIVSRLSSTYDKGHDLLLAAMPHILKTYPQARLVIVGDGEDRQRIERLANAYSLGKHVWFTGFLHGATLKEIYDGCSIFVMPSQTESFGIVYLEAMRARKPCVALRGSGAEEIVDHEKTGLLIEDRDPEQLACALVRLLTQPQLSEQLGEAGYEHWQKRFSYDVFQSRFIEHLDRLMSMK